MGLRQTLAVQMKAIEGMEQVWLGAGVRHVSLHFLPKIMLSGR
jgi:hypothetical protein